MDRLEIAFACLNLLVGGGLTAGLLWNASRQNRLSESLVKIEQDHLEAAKPKLVGEFVAYEGPQQIPDGQRLEGWGVQLYNLGRSPVDILDVKLLSAKPAENGIAGVAAQSPVNLYVYTSGLDQARATELPLRIAELGSLSLWLETHARGDPDRSAWLRIHRPGDVDFVELNRNPKDPELEELTARFGSIRIVGQAPYGSLLGPTPRPRAIPRSDPLDLGKT